MILRSIRTEGLGCFADAFTAGPFAPGINIVHAPNATGKSTLFRAVSLAFLEPHRGKSAEIQALRPWGRRLSPQVGVEFEHAGRIYRIRKRFLDGASAHVETREGDSWTSFAQGDHADEFLRELLQSESGKPRSAKREHWGLAQVLWTTQGDLSMPPLASTVIDSIRNSVGAQLTARDSAIDARVNEEYLKYYSPLAGRLKSGRNAAPQCRFEAERDRLEGELQTAEELLRQFEGESKSIELLRATEAAATVRRDELAKDLEGLRAGVDEYKRLRSEQRERTALRDGAQARHKGLSERIQSIVVARRQIAECEESLAQLKTEIPALTAQFDEMQKDKVASDLACANATAAESQARASLHTAQAADQYVRALAERSGLAQRLAEIAAAKMQMQTAVEKKAELNAPTEAQVRELRAVLAKETDARRRLDLARITVGFVPEARIEVQVIAGEQPGTVICEAGERVLFSGAPNLNFAIPGVGQFDASGPVADYESIRRDLDEHRAWIASFTGQFGAADPDVLDNRRREAAEFDAGIRETHRAITKLLDGNTEAALCGAYSDLSERVQIIEAQHAEWCSQPPDAAEMMAAANAALTDSAAMRNSVETAARIAHALAGEAQSQLKIATAQQTSLQEQMEQARRLLTGILADGVNDGDRRKLLEQAALDYDVCRIALERIDNDLRPFAEDPAIVAKRISTEMDKVSGHASSATRERLQAETRIQGLVDRRPYATASELSESLAVLREQIDREQRRMKALALLHKTLEEARTEMMVAVAAPVERIATDYLEEICGKPIAEIRLTQSLAAERVIPAALADDADPSVDLDRLSGGEREQIFLCTRIALGSEVARRERQMVVLDDALTFTDKERMNRICRLLARVSDRLQLIILTCHPERFANLTGANRIDLHAALDRKLVNAHV
jgi:DNA repair exonuclease SbcCD ATPase subunit